MKHLRILSYVDVVARSGSIRKAAEQLHVTASAVNRRIADLEAELGTQLFERLPRGVRLTAAGELFVHYLRRQTSDAERMRSQIEDLKGLRRGTVRIACSQALAFDFLPRAIAEFRRAYPQVNFVVKVVDHEYAMAALAAFDVDLVLVFRPPFLPNFQPLMTLEQRLVAMMPKEHPLASKRKLRLHDCVGYPLALPERAIGGRQLLEEVTARTGLRFNVVAEFELVRIVARPGRIRRSHFFPNTHRRSRGAQQTRLGGTRNRRARYLRRPSGLRSPARPESFHRNSHICRAHHRHA